MSQTRLAAILAADVAGYSRLMGADEEGTLERLKAPRGELFDPKIAEHKGRIVKTTGDGLLVEFASVVDAVSCAVAVQQAMPERHSGIATDSRIELRIGINLGDVIVEGDDLYGDGVNIAARIEALADAGGVFISNTVHDQVRDRLPFVFEDLGEQQVKNIARPLRVYRVGLWSAAPTPTPPSPASGGGRGGACGGGKRADSRIKSGDAGGVCRAGARSPQQAVDRGAALRQYERRPGAGVFRRRDGRGDHYRAQSHPLALRPRPQFELHLQGPGGRCEADRPRTRSSLRPRRLGAQGRQPGANHRAIDRCGHRSPSRADRFDGSLEDVFELQDKVASSVAGVIEPALQAAENARAAGRPTADLTAYDLYLRAYAMVFSSAAQIPEALRLLEQAIARDPLYGPALAFAAHCCFRLVEDGRSDDSDADALKGPALARRALEAAGDDPGVLAHAAQALAYFGEDIGAMMALVDRALSLNPNFARGWLISGILKLWAGQPDIAIEHVEAALRLSPRARIGGALFITGRANFLSLRFDEAVPKLLEVAPRDPGASKLHAAVSLSRGLLRADGSARRRTRNCRAAKGHHPCRDKGRQRPAEVRAPRALPVGPAPGGGRDMSETRRLAASRRTGSAIWEGPIP
jgi:class 3 adenylate cyclase